MLWIGLTGGIACGKSTVSRSLVKRGYAVVDADVLAREVVRAGTRAHAEIVAIFGADAIDDQGELHRPKIASEVFSDRSKLDLLEGVIHPLVRQRAAQWRVELEARGDAAAFYDVPLLFEKKMTSLFDQTVVVTCRGQVQLERLMERNGLSEADAQKRIANQLPLSRKEAAADHLIQNNSDEASLELEIDRVLRELGLPRQAVHHAQT